MYTLTDLANGKERAKDRIEGELISTIHGLAHDGSSHLHDVISLLWLMPETEKREALRKKLYTLTDEINEMLHNELQDYYKEIKGEQEDIDK